MLASDACSSLFACLERCPQQRLLMLPSAGIHVWMQAVVVRMLSDSKLEVREVAATTLSGLLKGASADEAARLRASFLADVDRLLPRNRKRQKAKAGADASGAPTMHKCCLHDEAR